MRPLPTVSHNGGQWTALRMAGRVPVWPIEEYIARTEHTPDEIEALKRENPGGKLEGAMPKGVKMCKPKKRQT